MRILDVRETTQPISSPIRNAYIDFTKMTTSLVAVVTDQMRDGRRVVGYGFNSNGRYGQGGLIRERFAPRLLEADPASLLDAEGVLDPHRAWACLMANEKPGGHGERSVAVGTLDMALWDAWAKLHNQPLFRLLAQRAGREADPRVFVYAAGGYYYPGKDLGALRAEMRGYLDRGYTVVKMKIGGAPLDEDRARIEAVLAEIGGAQLAVDANGRFDLETAIAYARMLRDYPLFWYEEAGDPLDYQLQAALAEFYPGPMATGENLFSHQDARNLLRHGGMRADRDWLQFDCALSYGLCEYLRTLDVIRAAGWSPSRCIPHGGHQMSLNIAAGLGLGGNESYPDLFQPYGGFPDSVRVRDGHITMPELPGIGFEGKADLIRVMRELAEQALLLPLSRREREACRFPRSAQHSAAGKQGANVLERRPTYAETRDAFAWRVPPRFNIAHAICDRHAATGGDALLTEAPDGTQRRLTFAHLQEMSSRLANALQAHGVQRGDRVAILLPQCAECLVAHLAAYRMGAIALPLFTLFGPEAIEYRLANSGARVLVTGDEGLAKLHGLRDRLPELRVVLGIDGAREGGVLDLNAELSRAASTHAPVDTAADDPALILYTSGTTGQPKGVLHAHRVLLGMLPGVELPHDFFPQPGDRMWTPADWAWAGGLLDVLLPSLFHGVPVLAHRLPKFDPDAAFALMARHGIRNAFMPPTALKIMRGVPPPRDPPRMRSVASGGERLGEEMLDWGRSTFGLTINEFYGQTEINLVVANCATLMPLRPGSMGRAVPGHDVAVLDDDGAASPPGETGSLAVRAPDPAMFLRYWNNPDATERKFRQGPDGARWCLTGDMGRADADGYLWFLGRDDDVIISAGYRIGPDEIEDCLMRHPAVGMVAVIGVPDPVRGEVVKAFVVPTPGHEAGPGLAAEIQAFVKARLSAHEYPRAIEFREDLPMTMTGKIRRRDLRTV